MVRRKSPSKWRLLSLKNRSFFSENKIGPFESELDKTTNRAKSYLIEISTENLISRRDKARFSKRLVNRMKLKFIRFCDIDKLASAWRKTVEEGARPCGAQSVMKRNQNDWKGKKKTPVSYANARFEARIQRKEGILRFRWTIQVSKFWTRNWTSSYKMLTAEINSAQFPGCNDNQVLLFNIAFRSECPKP